MYLIENKAIAIDGNLIFVKDPTVIELEVSGTCFPDILRVNNTFQFKTTGLGNEMYIDYADGTGVHTYQQTSVILGFFAIVEHYYQDLVDTSKIGTIDSNYSQRRKIKVSFKYPSRINEITWRFVTMYGKFPESLGNYNLTGGFRIENTRYIDEFPLTFRGVNTGNLALSNVTTNIVAILPEWIYNSKIAILNLTVSFLFGGSPIETNLDKLINTVGLTSLTVQGLNNNSVPSNWKDIATLRMLGVGNSYFTTLPSNISLMSQLTSLIVSSSPQGYNSNYNSWGDGIGLMTNLSLLTYEYINIANLTTAIPTGAELCWKLKNINCGGSYNSVARTDAHLTAWYNCTTAFGDMTATINNKFRGVAFSIYFQTANSKRPTGIYQAPSEYVQGSSNGTPASVMEMIYVLVKQYKWVVTILNSAGTGSEILAP